MAATNRSTGQWMRRSVLRRHPRRVIAGALLVALVTLWFPWQYGLSLVRADPNLYTDSALGFTLRLLPGWQLTPQEGTSATPGISTVALTTTEGSPLDVLVTVQQGQDMPSRFAQQIQTTTTIGTYPASARAYAASAQMPTACEERIFLAGDDYVDATWCGAEAEAQSSTVERLLSGFRAPEAGIAPATTVTNLDALQTGGASIREAVAPKALSCLSLQRNDGYAGTPSWGTELASPKATSPFGGWNALAPGVALCSNTASPDTWLFQCTELVNRFLRERWGLGALPETGDLRPGSVAGYLAGNAGMYVDWWGAFGSGKPVHFAGSADSKSDTVLYSDARWAKQFTKYGYTVDSTRPVPGDILVWQDVTNPAKGPISGSPARHDSFGNATTIYPGHVAIVTSSTAHTLTVAQQNFSDSAYFDTVSISPSKHGGWIIDPHTGARTGDAASVFVGWIHFTEDDAKGSGTGSVHAQPTPPTKPHLPKNLAAPTPVVIAGSTNQPEVFARTTTEHIVRTTNQNGAWTAWQQVGDKTLMASDPALINDTYVYARSAGDNQIRQTIWTGNGWSPWMVIGGSLTGGFVGDPVVGAAPNIADPNYAAVYALGADKHLYMTYVQNGAWVHWQSVGDATLMAGMPVVVDSTLIYMRSASDNLLRQSAWTDSGWSPWTVVSGAVPGGFVGDPVTSLPPSDADHRFPEVYATSAQGHVFTTYYKDGAWLAWQEVGDKTSITSDPAAFNSALVYARGTKGGQIMEASKTSAGWSSWQTLGGSLPFAFVGNIATALPSAQADPHHAQVYAVDQLGDLLVTDVQNGQWISWQPVGDDSVIFA